MAVAGGAAERDRGLHGLLRNFVYGDGSQQVSRSSDVFAEGSADVSGLTLIARTVLRAKVPAHSGFMENTMAAVNQYVVRLIDCARTRTGNDKGGAGTGVGNHASAVCLLLKTWYTSVCQQASRGGTVWTADVQWQPQPSSAPPGDDAGAPLTVNLILFFIPIPRDSLILLHPNYSNGFVLSAVSDHSLGGETVTEGTTRANRRTPTLGLSEIYVDRLQERDAAETPLNIARMAFHESMHNQLQMSNNALHRQGGFAAASPAGTAPSGANISAMAGGIGTLIPQWTGGFQAWLDWDKARPR